MSAEPTPEPVDDDDVAALLEMDDEEFAEVIEEAIGSPEREDDWRCLLDVRVVGRTIPVLKRLVLAGEHRRSELYEALNSAADNAAAAPPRSRRREITEGKREISRLLSRHRELGLRLGLANKISRSANYAINLAQQEAREQRGAPSKDERLRAHVKRCDEEVRLLRNALRAVTFAIQNHRLAAVDAGLIPESTDRRLWSVLDEVEVPLGQGAATLTEMLGCGAWTEASPP